MDPYAAPELVYRPGPSLSIAIAVITVAFASPNLKTIRCLILLEPLRVIAAPHPPGPPPRTHPARRPTPPGDPHPTLPPGLRPKCQQRAAPQPRSPRAEWRSGACLAGRREELVVAACACVCSGPSFLQPPHTHALTTASTSMRDAVYDDEAPSPLLAARLPFMYLLLVSHSGAARSLPLPFSAQHIHQSFFHPHAMQCKCYLRWWWLLKVLI